jgi:hypothetical protein
MFMLNPSLLMPLNTIIQSCVGADFAVSKKKTGNEIGLYTVTLSRSEGSVFMVLERCFAALSMTGL